MLLSPEAIASKTYDLPKLNNSFAEVIKDHSIEGKLEGEYEINHQGVHFKGVKNGEPFSFDMDYRTVMTYPISVDLTVFSLFVNGEQYDFFPDFHCVGKVIMLTEEIHRLHINRWKNFPWFDYMYEGKELGIDLKK